MFGNIGCKKDYISHQRYKDSRYNFRVAYSLGGKKKLKPSFTSCMGLITNEFKSKYI